MKPRTADLAVSAFFLVAGQLEVWIWWVPAEQGPRWAAAAYQAALALALVQRRRAPLLVQLVMSALLAAWALTTPPAGSLIPWFAMIVAAYSVAAYQEFQYAAVGLAVNSASWVLFVAMTTNSVADYAFILGFVLAGWLAGVVVRTRETRAATAEARAGAADERARTAAADERARIAREIHDIVSHSVSVMVVQAAAAETVLASDPARAREPLLRIQETGREAMSELKRLLGLLRDSDEQLVLVSAPSLAHLDALLGQIRQAGMPVRLDVRGEPRVLPPGVDLSAYRIIQEGLTNALRYAGPAEACVSVTYGEDRVVLEILDDGQGDGYARHAGAGHGLLGLRERVSVHGGELAAGPRPEGGYALQATLPL